MIYIMSSLIYVLVFTVFAFKSSSGSSDSSSDSSDDDDDCNTESWETVSSASLSPSRRNSAVLVNECEILLFGGLNGGVPNTTPTVTSLNTLSSNPSWTELGPVADDMNGPWFPTTQGAVFVDSNIYITCEDAADGKIWEYTRNGNTFNVINDDNRMIFPSEDCCAFGVNNEIYIFGGQRFGTSYDNVQIYNVDTNEWRLGSSMNIAREDMGCTIVNDRYVYLFGGAQGSDVLNSVEKYDIVDDTWQFFENSLNPARRSLSAKYIPDTNEILLVGGMSCYIRFIIHNLCVCCFFYYYVLNKVLVNTFENQDLEQ